MLKPRVANTDNIYLQTILNVVGGIFKLVHFVLFKVNVIALEL